MLKVSNKLWLVSDTHFGHKNIVVFQQRPVTHEEIMLSEWIWRVREDDQILHRQCGGYGVQARASR